MRKKLATVDPISLMAAGTFIIVAGVLLGAAHEFLVEQPGQGMTPTATGEYIVLASLGTGLVVILASFFVAWYSDQNPDEEKETGS